MSKGLTHRKKHYTYCNTSRPQLEGEKIQQLPWQIPFPFCYLWKREIQHVLDFEEWKYSPDAFRIAQLLWWHKYLVGEIRDNLPRLKRSSFAVNWCLDQNTSGLNIKREKQTLQPVNTGERESCYVSISTILILTQGLTNEGHWVNTLLRDSQCGKA